jgi:tetratricopeptide (TPR) repeat protein
VRDPLCRLCRLNLVQAYVESGQFDNAESLLPSVDDPRLDSLRANVSLLQGNFAEALVQFDALGERWWSRLKGRSMALYSLGLNEASLESLAELEAHDDQQSTLLIAEVHAWRQEPELALAWIEKAIEQIGPEWVLSEVLRNPVLKSYATRPPLSDWASEYDLAPDQLQAIAFDLQLPGN